MAATSLTARDIEAIFAANSGRPSQTGDAICLFNLDASYRFVLWLARWGGPGWGGWYGPEGQSGRFYAFEY